VAHTGYMRPRNRLLTAVSAVGVLTVAGGVAIASTISGSTASTAVPGNAAAARPSISVVAERTIAEDLTSPWGLAFLPDGSALISERDTAQVRRIASRTFGLPAANLTRAQVVGKVSGVRPDGEGGLLGIAIPETIGDAEPDYIFAYLTAKRDNRVVRIEWDGRRLGKQTPILTGIPKASYHNGGRIITGPNRTLFVATGDAGDPDLSQDQASLAGKVLRIDYRGNPAPGNPFEDSPVYTLGHRNVQGLALDNDGRLWATEFGTRKADELNLLRPGRNYGWPIVEGRSNNPRFTNPKVTWEPTSTASPSGMTITDDAAYVASLRGEVVWRVPLKGAQAGKPQKVDIEKGNRLRTIELAPDGRVWLATSNTDGRGDPGPRDDRIVSFRLTD